MFARPVQPRGTAGGPLTPWLVICRIWSVIAAFWLAWAAGRLAALVTGRPADGPDSDPTSPPASSRRLVAPVARPPAAALFAVYACSWSPPSAALGGLGVVADPPPRRGGPAAVPGRPAPWPA